MHGGDDRRSKVFGSKRFCFVSCILSWWSFQNDQRRRNSCLVIPLEDQDGFIKKNLLVFSREKQNGSVWVWLVVGGEERCLCFYLITLLMSSYWQEAGRRGQVIQRLRESNLGWAWLVCTTWRPEMLRTGGRTGLAPGTPVTKSSNLSILQNTDMTRPPASHPPHLNTPQPLSLPQHSTLNTKCRRLEKNMKNIENEKFYNFLACIFLLPSLI